jgi:glutathione S-transferase
MDQQIFPKAGTADRYRCMEWMNFIATEVHKSFSPLFGADRISKNVDTQNEIKNYYRDVLKTKIQFISDKMGTNDYLMGKNFTIADAYLFTCLSWSKFLGLDLSAWENIANYMNRVASRSAVQRAMKEEGLI